MEGERSPRDLPLPIWAMCAMTERDKNTHDDIEEKRTRRQTAEVTRMHTSRGMSAMDGHADTAKGGKGREVIGPKRRRYARR